MQIPGGDDERYYNAGRRAFADGVKPLSQDPPMGTPAWWVNEGLKDAAAGLPSRTSSEDEQEQLVKLFWTKASILFEGKQDPYNEAYRKFIEDKERKKRQGGEDGAVQTTLLAVTGTVLSLISSTGIGAVLVAAYEILNLIGTYLIPPSEGGWEKLSALQRQKANLYQLHPSYEASRNKTRWQSQHMDLTVPDLGAQTVYTQVGGLNIPSLGTGTIPPQYHDQRFPLYVRNLMIRAAYAREFHRVVTTDDEPTLPAVVINLLGKASMWPPPLPPEPIDTAAVPSEAKPIYETQYRILSNQYASDIKDFAAVASIITMSDDLRALAEKSGCIPELNAPGVFPSAKTT